MLILNNNYKKHANTLEDIFADLSVFSPVFYRGNLRCTKFQMLNSNGRFKHHSLYRNVEIVLWILIKMHKPKVVIFD